MDHIVGASGGPLACGSNSQLCPEGHPALTPLAVTIRSNFSSRKYYSPILPFFFFLSLWRFVFVCSLFILFHTGWGSRLGRPRISGLWVGCYLWCTSLSAGLAPPSQLAAAAGRCLQSGICSGPAEGWLPAPADGQDDALAVSSIFYVTPTHVGPRRPFLLSS